MAKKLILFRHAKSDWDSGAASDHARPLARRGVEAARVMGKFLMSAGEVPDQVLCSTAVRAMATVQLAAKAGGWIVPMITLMHSISRIPTASFGRSGRCRTSSPR